MTPDRLVPEAERRRITSVSRTRWHLLERAGLAPRRRLVTENRVAWLESELTAWVASRPVGGGRAPVKS
ncbi:MAG TPA: AlpA family phage regulatory protein [Vicinamibacteria bacterium]|jgi:predicted DNA-binding transcriptional regulator AlpA|nr:AlpA family phage regulatory protein [Vicinamibacteria bacterium]